VARLVAALAELPRASAEAQAPAAFPAASVQQQAEPVGNLLAEAAA
jgi:hypothetical protein